MRSSLDVLEDVVRREYDAQERRADSLDTKAGLILGFAGLLVSLGMPDGWPPLTLFARLLAGGAAVLALRVFAVPGLPALDLSDLSDRSRSPSDLRQDALLTLSRSHTRIVDRIEKKYWRIRAALHLLVGALGIIAVSAAVDAARDLMG